MVKALIIYVTCYGTTANVSKIISEVLNQEGFEVIYTHILFIHMYPRLLMF
jgi:flavodoxin